MLQYPVTNDSILLPPSSKELLEGTESTQSASEPLLAKRPGRAQQRPWSRRRTILTVTLLAIAAITISLIWVGVRGAMAANAAFTGGQAATELQAHMKNGDAGRARESVIIIQKEAREAAGLTSDPVWRALELVPFVGNNLVAIRSGFSSLEVVTSEALDPIVTLSSALDIDSLLNAGRAERLSFLTGAAPQIVEIDTALQEASSSIAGINATATIEPLATVFEGLRHELARYSGVTAGLAGLSKLVPPQISSETDATWSIQISSGAHREKTDLVFLTVVTGPGGFSVSEILPAESMTDDRIVGEPLSIPVESLTFLLSEAGPQFLPGLAGGNSFSEEELSELIAAGMSGDAMAQQTVGERTAGLLAKLVG